MSDNFDSLLAGLEDEPEPKEEKAPSAPKGTRRKASGAPRKGRTPAKAAEAAKSEQRGPRADPSYRQVNANIPRELHASLFFYLKQEGRTLSSLIEELLAEYVEEQGGIIGAKRKR